MIQRIQSVYLFLAGLLPLLSVTTPLGRFHTEAGYYLMTAIGYAPIGIAPLADGGRMPYGVLCLTILISVLSWINILRYKRRKQQVRLCNWTITFCIVYYLTLISYAVAFGNHASMSFKPAPCAIFPLLSLIFTLLARRAILRDEALVRAADRFR